MLSKDCDKKRPNWDEYFILVMEAIAKRATCDRGRSGCVIAKDKQLISAGYVGSAVGDDHCDDVGHLMQKRYNADGTYSEHCVRTVHAEQNAICQAAKRGVSVDGATLYCRMTPCPVCAKMIANCGIKRVVCQKKYHDGAEAERIFSRSGIALVFQSEEEQEYSNKGVQQDAKKTPFLEKKIDVTRDDNGNITKSKLKIKKIHPTASIPMYAHDGDAGLDLYAIEGGEIEPQGRAKFGTGIAVEIPAGHVGLIWDRSGLSTKKGLKTLGGVIDSTYRGEIIVALANISNEPVQIMQGDRIAQLLIQKVESVGVEVVDQLEESQRGQNGFGSTDKIDFGEDKKNNKSEYTPIKEKGTDDKKGRW